ncbi:hypothetical protein PRNP1_002427 [Phytophthora ramorum]
MRLKVRNLPTAYDFSAVDETNKGEPTNLLSQCDERFFTQTLDHFDVGAPTYQQRYFVCDQHFRPGGVMFFYVGNEADVELYLNHTGLMWENAGEFGAMLVFAEHRYFGKSVPFGKDVTKHMRYLSTEQTLADYAVLITYLKGDLKRDIPVIGFGGSYGGMLGSWFRMKYPHIIDGVVAGSAPILSFLGDENYSDSVVAVHIEGGAHHLDFMFSNPLDPEPPKAARATEKQHMRKRTSEFYAHKAA